MAQHDYVIANGTGAAVRSDLNNALAAIVSQNSGATEPATTYAYQWWADTTTNLLKLRNSANSGWITLFQLDGEYSTIALENGTAAAPSIYFKDSGTDTGFYSPGANQVGISTGGTARLTIDSNGNVNIDSNTLYVDAANNRVGLGTSTPSAVLDVSGNSKTSTLQIGTNPAGVSIGVLGIPNQKRIYGRNAANTGDVSILYIDGSNGMVFGPNDAAVIDSSGRLGIGTIAPDSLLHCGTTSAADNVAIKVQNASATDSAASASIVFTQGANYAAGEIRSVRLGNYSATAANQDSALAFYTANDGANGERARIDSSGRLLVGTSSARTDFFNAASTYTPRFQLEGSDASGSTMMSLVSNNSAGLAPYLVFALQKSGSSGGDTVVADGNELGHISFQGNDGSEMVSAASITAQVDGTPGANDMPGRLVFSTTADGVSSPTERMRITSTGAVLVNTTTTATNALFEVSSNGAKKSFQVYNNDNVQLYSLGTGTVYSNGGVLTNTNPSDERLKDSIETLGWGLEEVMALRPVSFDWKNNRTNQGRQYGFIAQEVQSVMPELVTEFETVDGDQTVTRLGLEKDGIYAALVKAIQEQQTMIADLQAKVAALKAS
jgi:hypothetical protein